MKKFILTFFVIFSVIIFTNYTTAQEMDPLDTSIKEIDPIIIIPTNQRNNSENYDNEEALEKINSVMERVQQRYEELLDGHTFILRKPRVKYLENISVGGINSNAVATNMVIPYLNYMQQILSFESGIKSSNTMPVMFVVGAPSQGSNLVQMSANNLAAAGPFNDYIWVSGPILDDIVFSDKNDKQALNRALHALAHEIGHIFGSSNHPCTRNIQDLCTWQQKRSPNLPPDSEFINGIMGYTKEPFDALVFNNSTVNPEIKALMSNRSINPDGDPIPEPEDSFLIKDGSVLATSQLQIYSDYVSPIKITGNTFGDQKGHAELTFVFSGDQIEQTIPVPDDFIEWTNDMITINLTPDFVGAPSKIKVTIITPSGKKIAIDGNIAVYVKNQPEILISPNPARRNNQITISGGNFGSPGEITYLDFSTGTATSRKLPIINWNSGEITAQLSLPAENTSSQIPLLILPSDKGGFYGGSVNIEQNNSLTQDVFFQVQIQCADQSQNPKPAEISLFVDDNLGLLSPITSGFTSSVGYISFLTPVTFNYGEPRNFTFTLNRRDGTSIDHKVSVNPDMVRVSVPINDPSCGTPVESYSLLISNNPSYNDDSFHDGSATLQIAGQQNPQTIDWTLSSQGDGTIYVNKITLNGNEEFQITNTQPGDIVDIPVSSVKLSIKSPSSGVTSPTEDTPAQTTVSCNPQPWSNEETDSENYRCDGDQACYAKWQEDPDNSCQPKQIGEDCRFKQECSDRLIQSNPGQSCEASNWRDEQPYSCENGWACYNRWKISGGNSCDPEPDYGEDGNWFVCLEDSNCGTAAPPNAE
jgi:hypothetical protein